MLQSILLPKADVVALRAAVAHPLFAQLLAAVPSLASGLQCPQPDFGPYLPWVSDAVGEVRSNTNYPEDWDGLSGAVDEACCARRKFSTATKAISAAIAPAPLRAFILVEEHMGSNDGAQFGKTAYIDFAAACAALKSRAEADFDPELDDDLILTEYSSIKDLVYGFNLLTKRGSVVRQYFVKGFELEMGSTPAAGDVA